MAKKKEPRETGKVLSLVDKDAPSYTQALAQMLRDLADEIESDGIEVETAVVCVHIPGYLPDVHAVGTDVEDGQRVIALLETAKQSTIHESLYVEDD